MKKMDSATLTINEAEFNSVKKAAQEQFEKTWGTSDGAGFSFDNLDFDVNDIEFKDGTLTVRGSVMTHNEAGKEIDLGFMSFEMDFSVELAIEVIEYYMKQVNKMKTVLEALK